MEDNLLILMLFKLLSHIELLFFEVNQVVKSPKDIRLINSQKTTFWLHDLTVDGNELAMFTGQVISVAYGKHTQYVTSLKSLVNTTCGSVSNSTTPRQHATICANTADILLKIFYSYIGEIDPCYNWL